MPCMVFLQGLINNLKSFKLYSKLDTLVLKHQKNKESRIVVLSRSYFLVVGSNPVKNPKKKIIFCA
jgi:hypothetical protein